MKITKSTFLISILTCLGLIPIGLYFYKFHYGLAPGHTQWGEFGSFLSPFVSLLAFVGVIYSIELTKKQFRRQSEESGFFSLLNVHLKNVEQIQNNNNGVPGDGFKFYIQEFAKIYKEKCYNFAREAIKNDINNISEFGYRFLYSKITRDVCFHAGEEEIEVVLGYLKKYEKDKDEALKMLTDGNAPEEDKREMRSIGSLYFEDSSSEFRYNRK